jgi:hypothetical protein
MGLGPDVQQIEQPVEDNLYPQLMGYHLPGGDAKLLNTSRPLPWKEPSQLEPLPELVVSSSYVTKNPNRETYRIEDPSDHQSLDGFKFRVRLPSQSHRFRCSTCDQRFQFAQQLRCVPSAA